jgi:hypothetical protein
MLLHELETEYKDIWRLSITDLTLCENDTEILSLMFITNYSMTLQH